MKFNLVRALGVLALLLCFSTASPAHEEGDSAVFKHPVSVKSPSKAFLTVRDLLAGVSVVRSDFKQKKSLVALKKPIVSSGNYIFSSQMGLYWNIGAPINTAYVLTDDYMVERQKGFKSKVVTPKEQPAIFGITEVFEAIFVGDLDRLSKDFAIHFVGSSSDWTIGLIPQRGLLQKMFKKVILKGGETVSEVKLFEGNGDSTHLKFLNTTRRPSTLSSAEKALFAR